MGFLKKLFGKKTAAKDSCVPSEYATEKYHRTGVKMDKKGKEEVDIEEIKQTF
ncbi:MAG: hypothetical protein WC310_03535 [Patescibacteria group bacterium]|jgi:hypothetical protein